MAHRAVLVLGRVEEQEFKLEQNYSLMLIIVDQKSQPETKGCQRL